MRKYQIVIPSRGRPENVRNILDIRGLDSEPIFFIPYEELQDYKAAYHNAHYECLHYKNLAQKRNMILEYMSNKHPNYDIVMMDDDLKSTHLAVSKTKMPPIAFNGMIDYIEQSLAFHKLKLAGVPQIASLFYYNPNMPFSTRNFVVSNLYYIRKDNKLRFDENLDVKSDYDYTLQNISEYGGALRCNCIMAKFEHWSNQGGLTGIRTKEKMMKAIEYLQKKWGNDIVVRNPKQGKEETEILLKVKRRPIAREISQVAN